MRDKINTHFTTFTYRINLAQRPANMVVTSNMQQRTKRQPTENHGINNAQRSSRLSRAGARTRHTHIHMGTRQCIVSDTYVCANMGAE